MNAIDMDVPTADAARQTYEQKLYEKAVAQSTTVAAAVKRSIASGATHVKVDYKLEPGVEAALKAKGYKIKYESGYDQRDGDSWSYTIISWDK